MSVKETAKRLGLAGSRVRVLAAQGRLPGAFKISSVWAIPESALKLYQPGRVGQPRKKAEE